MKKNPRYQVIVGERGWEVVSLEKLHLRLPAISDVVTILDEGSSDYALSRYLHIPIVDEWFRARIAKLEEAL